MRHSTLTILLFLSIFQTVEKGSGQNNTASAAENTKLGNIRIANIPVNGLTPQQARQRLLQKLEPRLKNRIALSNGKKTVQRRRSELGIVSDVEGMVAQAKSAQGKQAIPLHWKVDRVAFQRVLRKLSPALNIPGKNARIVERGGSVRVTPSASPRVVDVGTSTQKLADLIEKKPAVTTLKVVLAKKPPKVTADMLKGITGRLSRFETKFNADNQKRVHNMGLALKSINETVLSPGKVFSLNQTVGERTQQRGYRTAMVFENKERVPGIGGGVSQVTGTLFNAVLLAGLPIVEYGAHSRPVPYLPVGRDATLAWNLLDLKFKNNTNAPVFIDFRLSGNRLIATLYGKRVPGQQVTLKVNKQKPDSTHVKTELYRTIKHSGKVVAKERIGRADYNWKPENPD